MKMEIGFPGGMRVEAEYKGFRTVTDQPLENGGDASAASPFDLFLASLGTCMGYYALRFCANRNLAVDGLELHLDFDPGPDGHAIEAIHVGLELPPHFPVKYRQAILAALDSCAVKRQMERPPRIEYQLAAEPLALTLH